MGQRKGNPGNRRLLELLEGRRLLSSASLSGGVLTITGNSSSANDLGAYVSGSNIVAQHNGATKSYSSSSVTKIVINGGSSSDNIWLTKDVSKPTSLNGSGGNDSIWAGSGKDTISGGSGNDELGGQAGNDSITGGDGDDTLYGGTGTDTLNGENGNDIRYDEQYAGGVTSDTGTDPDPTPAPEGSTNAVSDFKVYSQDKSTGKIVFRYTYNSAGGTYTLIKNGSSTGVTDTNGDIAYTFTSGTASFQVRDKNGVLSNSVSVTAGSTSTPPPADDGGGSIPNDTSATAPKPVITALYGTSVMAGQSIHVHGTSSSLGSGSPQNALYEWNFGDSGSDYNNLQGFNAAHLYENPGTYKVTLTVTNQAGKVNQTSINVTVSSDSRKTIYVSSSGNDSNSGTSSSSPIKSWSKAASMANSASNIEILFKRGETFSAGTVMDINGDNVVVGAYGSGNKPVINWNVSVSGYPSVVSPDGDDITVRDLTFTSSVSNAPQAVRASGNNVTVLDNQFLKLGYAINANGKPNGLLVQGNDAPDVSGIKSYFLWSEGSDHVLLGNTVRNSREEHAVRVVGTDRVLVWDNDLTNTTGEASGDDTPKGALTLHKGSYYWVARNNLNKGPVAIGPLGNGDGMDDKGARFRYGVFDGNVIDTKLFVDHGAEHIMVRNNVIKSNGDSAVTVEGYNSTYGRTTVDVMIVNNTVMNSSSTGRAFKIQSGADSVSLLNNLYVAPSLQSGSGASGSVWIEAGSMDSIDAIDNNVWASASASQWAQGGQNFVGTSTGSQSGYKDPNEWNGLSGVGTDVFSDISISGSYAPSSSTVVNSTGEAYMGVFQDMNGKTRSAFSAGAVEV